MVNLGNYRTDKAGRYLVLNPFDAFYDMVDLQNRLPLVGMGSVVIQDLRDLSIKRITYMDLIKLYNGMSGALLLNAIVYRDGLYYFELQSLTYALRDAYSSINITVDGVEHNLTLKHHKLMLDNKAIGIHDEHFSENLSSELLLFGYGSKKPLMSANFQILGSDLAYYYVEGHKLYMNYYFYKYFGNRAFSESYANSVTLVYNIRTSKLIGYFPFRRIPNTEFVDKMGLSLPALCKNRLRGY